MINDYTFLHNDQLKTMEDTLENKKRHIDFLHDRANILEYQVSIYKNALDILSQRTNELDVMTANESIYSDHAWSAKQWKEWAIASAIESREESKKERES